MKSDTMDVVQNLNLPNRTRATLDPGTVVNQVLRIQKWLGSGGMSDVYEAEHLALQRTVAVKLLHRDLAKDSNNVMRFHREACAVAHLDHPNIVKVFSVGFHEDRPFMSMELLTGQSLAAIIAAEKLIPVERAMPIFDAILNALAHSHEQGIIHRDLKPSNVMLLADGQVKVVDFGLARILPESGKDMQKLTQTGSMLGTILYMSPEQLMGQTVDARSDLYSMGCLMHEVLTGVCPFAGDTPIEIIARHLRTLPGRPEGISDALWNLIVYALHKDPADRPQSAQAMCEMLHHQELIPQIAPPKKSSAKEAVILGPTPKRKNVWQTAGVVLAGAVVTAGIALFWMKPWQQDPIVKSDPSLKFNYMQDGYETSLDSSADPATTIRRQIQLAESQGNLNESLFNRAYLIEAFTRLGKPDQAKQESWKALNAPMLKIFVRGMHVYLQTAAHTLALSDIKAAVKIQEQSFAYAEQFRSEHPGVWSAAAHELVHIYEMADRHEDAQRILKLIAENPGSTEPKTTIEDTIRQPFTKGHWY